VAGLLEAAEEVLVQALIAQAADEALGEAVLLRLARRDVVPFDVALLGRRAADGYPSNISRNTVDERASAARGKDRYSTASPLLVPERLDRIEMRRAAGGK
jgi:hypothetical protein